MRARLAALAVGASLACAGLAYAASRDALWTIVHGTCVPDEVQNHQPAPCAVVDLAAGYVVLKDINGNTQFLLIPTAKVEGIESPEITAEGAPNYFEDAWSARKFVVAASKRDLPRDALALAINSPLARSQDQLHIHVDCIKPLVRRQIAANVDAVGETWAPFPGLILGHAYRARWIAGEDLGTVNPFRLLADAIGEGAMAHATLVLAGAAKNGAPGFVLLADEVNGDDPAAGEELQDHSCRIAGEAPQ